MSASARLDGEQFVMGAGGEKVALAVAAQHLLAQLEVPSGKVL